MIVLGRFLWEHTVTWLVDCSDGCLPLSLSHTAPFGTGQRPHQVPTPSVSFAPLVNTSNGRPGIASIPTAPARFTRTPSVSLLERRSQQMLACRLSVIDCWFATGEDDSSLCSPRGHKPGLIIFIFMPVRMSSAAFCLALDIRLLPRQRT